MSRHKFINPSSSYNKPKNTNFIPEEIVEQILARVPVEHLLRFKCVSKSWLSLITSPFFVKTHLNLSSSLRIISTFQNPVRVKHCSPGSLMATDIDFPGKNLKNRHVNVVGSCNGLVCIIIDNDELFIWNPLTRIYKKLPPVNVERKEIKKKVYGFGYNESNDDYKVVCVFVPLKDLGSKVTVYSSRTDLWNMVGNFKAGFPMFSNGCFLVGKIHFPAHRFSETNNLAVCYDVVSFDIGNEVYQTIEQPDHGEDAASELFLEVLNGCLCVLYNKHTCADLWVMKEYGVKESWSKTLSIPYFKFEDNIYSLYSKLRYSTPFVMLSSGEILLADCHHFVVYNPKDKTMWVPGSRNISRFMGACVYVESLVSPFGLEVLGHKKSDEEREQYNIGANRGKFKPKFGTFSSTDYANSEEFNSSTQQAQQIELTQKNSTEDFNKLTSQKNSTALTQQLTYMLIFSGFLIYFFILTGASFDTGRLDFIFSFRGISSVFKLCFAKA